MADQPAPPFPILASPLVGRARERAALRERLDAMLARRGSLVLIGGEAGVGNSALPEELLVEARASRASVLAGHCYDLAETPPYGPWAEALARLTPPPGVLAALMGEVAVASQAALFARVREELAARAARQPLVVLIDDL